MGVFVTCDVKAGEEVGLARIGNKRTPLGRFTNHSKFPNAHMVGNNGTISLVALQDLTGCLGGQPGEEVTVDYRQARQIGLEQPKALCQQ
jgi:SET domain-containing protein